MGSCGQSVKKQFQLNKFFLEHDDQSQFYLSCWQKSESPLPLLLCRGVLFLFSLAIVLVSMIWFSDLAPFSFWFTYLTHWGVLCVMFTTGTSFAISARYYRNRLIENELALPWYLKTYWVLYNITIPIAFMITVFYYAFLANALEEYAPNRALDVLAHAMNSVIMFLELIISAVPSRILHFYHTVCFGLVYIVFGVIYYFAGGLDLFGNSYIYPMIDWSSPGSTSLVVLLTAILLIVMHVLVVLLAAARNALAKRWKRNVKSRIDISE